MEFDNGSNDFQTQSSEIKPNYTKKNGITAV